MRPRPHDSGVTLIEVLVTVALMGAMMAIAVAGYNHWSRAREQSGTAEELQARMRQAQQRAVTEGTAMCVLFETDSYAVYEGTCGDPGDRVEGPFEAEGRDVAIRDAAFSDEPANGATFYARGSATGGSVKVTRTGSSTTYLISVEELTGRVSLD